MYLFEEKILKTQLILKTSMGNKPIKINKLENSAQDIIGGRIVRGNLQNYGSFSVAPRSPLALLYGPRVTVDTNESTIYVDNLKYLFKAERLADKFVSETDQPWTIDENPPKENKQTRKQKKFWKYVPD